MLNFKKKSFYILIVIFISIGTFLFSLWSKKNAVMKTVTWVERNGGQVDYGTPKRYLGNSSLKERIFNYFIGPTVVSVKLSNENLKDFSPLTNFNELRWLSVDKCGVIEDFNFFLLFKYIENIDFPIDSITQEQVEIFQNKRLKVSVNLIFPD